MAWRKVCSNQVLRIALAALCVLSLAGCSDGYPTEDVPQIEPASMSQAQLLAALNALGKEAHDGKRWSYALHTHCELEIVMHAADKNRRRLVLEGAGVSTRSVDGVTEIRLTPKSDGEEQSMTVLETLKWSDTVRARSLLTHLEVSCRNPVAPPA